MAATAKATAAERRDGAEIAETVSTQEAAKTAEIHVPSPRSQRALRLVRSLRSLLPPRRATAERIDAQRRAEHCRDRFNGEAAKTAEIHVPSPRSQRALRLVRSPRSLPPPRRATAEE